MSSDSDEDIYGNAAKKLKMLCSQSYAKKLDRSEILSDTTEINKIIECVSPSPSINNIIPLIEDDINKDNLLKRHAIPIKPDYPSDLSDVSDTEWFVETHQNSKRRQTVKKSRRVSKKTFSKKPVKVTEMSDSNTNNSPLKGIVTKKKTKRKTKNPQDVQSLPLLDRLVSEGPHGYQYSSDTNTRNNLLESIQSIQTLASRGTSRGLRNRSSRRAGLRPHSTSQCPTYNIGNTAEYPDNSEDIPLFSSKPTNQPNILEKIVISDEEPDDNEEVSIHVHWQNYEVFKFNVRKYQKLKQIFDFFAKKENVSENRLFFAYNDVVLTCDDSPDSIKYNIATFIEGGLISLDLIKLVRDHTSNKPSGIQIKFQCQNIRRPYESTVQLNEKLSLAMVKCAEHFEKPLCNLRFEFDGERIMGSATAKQLELESGDCIDVRIIK